MRWQIGEKLEEIPKEQLNGILQFFLAEIRKNDGTNYEPLSFIHLLNLVAVQLTFVYNAVNMTLRLISDNMVLW